MKRIAAMLLVLVGAPLTGSPPMRASQQGPSEPALAPALGVGNHAADTAKDEALKTLPKYDPNSGRPFQVDLRGRDLSNLDLRGSLDSLLYADFDDRTVWPAPDRMPSGFDRQRIMDLGKNPGLGVRRLHEEGITGRGVRIAIIDQALLRDHREYAGRVRLYEEVDLPDQAEPEMHGAAVASIALGRTVGVAPEAELYYIAKPGGGPLERLARCVRRIVEINVQLPKNNKIRVISISKGWTPRSEGYEDITEAVRKAQSAGMLVVCASVEQVHEGFDFDALGRPPFADPDAFESYEPGLFRSRSFWSHPPSPTGVVFWAPMDSRTTASPGGVDEYVFYRVGGFSWTVPYIAGVYALAVQADPAITPERFWALAVRTGRTIELNRDGMTKPLGPIIDPVRLIHAIQAGETATLSRTRDGDRIAPAPRQTDSETRTIASEVCIDDCTLGMSKDEVLKRLGKPASMFWAGETYTSDNLPRRYSMSYEDLVCTISDGVLTGITVFSPSYRFAGGLGVGDSVEKVKQVLGNDFRLEEYPGKDILTYDDKGLSFEIRKDNGTVAEVNVFQPKGKETSSPRTRRDDTLEAYADAGGTIPYAAGVLALGRQVRPDLSPDEMKELLFALIGGQIA
jgi:subtilisin family serine protease